MRRICTLTLCSKGKLNIISTFSVNLTKCQVETQTALDKLALDPPLLGVFVAKCKPDGQYEDQQCHELYCWCVDKDGKKIPDTTVRGAAVCLPQGKCSTPGLKPCYWQVMLKGRLSCYVLLRMTRMEFI